MIASDDLVCHHFLFNNVIEIGTKFLTIKPI